MKIRLAFFALLCLGLLIAGCGKKGSSVMVGSWEFVPKPENKALLEGKITARLDFTAGGTFSGNIHAMTADSNVEGTYKLEDKALTLVTTKVNDKNGAVTESATLSADEKSFDMPQFQGMGSMVKK